MNVRKEAEGPGGCAAAVPASSSAGTSSDPRSLAKVLARRLEGAEPVILAASVVVAGIGAIGSDLHAALAIPAAARLVCQGAVIGCFGGYVASLALGEMIENGVESKRTADAWRGSLRRCLKAMVVAVVLLFGVRGVPTSVLAIAGIFVAGRLEERRLRASIAPWPGDLDRTASSLCPSVVTLGGCILATALAVAFTPLGEILAETLHLGTFRGVTAVLLLGHCFAIESALLISKVRWIRATP